MMELSESSVINSFLQHSGLSLSQLALVTICTEGEMDAWKEYQQSLPSVWINGYDVRKVLTEKELYFCVLFLRYICWERTSKYY